MQPKAAPKPSKFTAGLKRKSLKPSKRYSKTHHHAKSRGYFLIPQMQVGATDHVSPNRPEIRL
jgi:hypothetical protein